MSEPAKPTEEISTWLAALHLSQYGSCFAQAGYRSIRDCAGLDDQRLREMQVLPTGHRRRILCSLMARNEGWPAPTGRWVFGQGRKHAGTCSPQPGSSTLQQSGGTQCLSTATCLDKSAPVPQCVPTRVTSLPVSSVCCSETPTEDTSTSGSLDSQCTMVQNEIYEGCVNDQPAGRVQPTRSYKLRHRPMPDIPDRNVSVSLDRNHLPKWTATQLHATGTGVGSQAIKKAPLERTLSPICPYGETFLYNIPDDLADSAGNISSKIDIKEAVKLNSQKKLGCTAPVSASGRQARGAYTLPWTLGEQLGGREAALGVTWRTLPVRSEQDISPYACYYSPPKTITRTGWLEKLSPHGNYVYQKRWVKFDGEILSYYTNDKDVYSKGFIPISAVSHIRSLGDSKFEVVTPHRVFLFRVEKEGDRHDWISVLQTAARAKRSIPQRSKCSANKCASMGLRGYRGPLFVSLMGTQLRLCKTEQDFKSGIGITIVELTDAHVKDVERRGFEINTPFKNFCFTADSEREKEEWIEAVQESIAETLSDYEVAEKIWFNKSNRSCADCSSPLPEWTSINLGVVICKKCAGQHRYMGSSISQVRSLKLDNSIWSNELVELFLTIGNKNANSFWAAALSPEEELQPGASSQQRAAFVCRKYRERRFCCVLEACHTQEQLNKALCAAVVQPDVLQTMRLVFSGADVMCATGDATYSTPYLLAQRAGQHLQMEFLYHNKLSVFPKLHLVNEKRAFQNMSFKTGFLCIAVSSGRPAVEKRAREEMVRRWCTLEGGFLSYYESEHTATALGRMDVSEVVTLATNRTNSFSGAWAACTFKMYLLSERTFTFKAETMQAYCQWLETLAKCFIPPAAEFLLDKDYELIGRLYYKEGHDLDLWRVGWFTLEDSNLYFQSGEDGKEDRVGLIRLKRLQELTVSTHAAGDEKMDMLLMVESGRTVYVRGCARTDFSLWHEAIRQAAGTDGRALSNQQLSKNDVPIVVDSCIAFVTQYGLGYEGIYQKNGSPVRVAQLLESFQKDARNVKLRAGQHQLEDVTDVLRSFLAGLEDALLCKELYPFWVSVLDEAVEKERVQKYSTLIQSLPKINRTTLAALMQHLYRIEKCSNMNQMVTHNLASVFSSCLFQTEGRMSQEIYVIEDLINNYVELFDVHEDQVKQMDTENSFITTWKDKMFSPAGDLIFEVYLEKKTPESCCLIKVAPSMRSDELADAVLLMRNMAPEGRMDLWTTYEVIENGELGTVWPAGLKDIQCQEVLKCAH